MPTDDPDRVLFYPAWVSRSGRISLRWGRPCDSPGEAQRAGKAAISRGDASLAFVVRFGGGAREPMARFTSPEPARKIIEHWESLWDATETEPTHAE